MTKIKGNYLMMIYVLGADITDYFNYGFTEETWMVYCEKQKRLRAENGVMQSTVLGLFIADGTTT